MKKRLAILMLAGIMAVSALTGCGKINDSQVVSTVDGDAITLGLANFYARMTQAQYETYYAGYLGEDMWNNEASEGQTYEEYVKSNIIEQLQEMYLLEDHMEEYNVSLTDEEKAAISEAAKKFDETNDLDNKEKVSGTVENVERFLTLITINHKMEHAIEDTADKEVSDEEAAQKAMQYVCFSFDTEDEEGNTTEMTDKEKEVLKKEAKEFAKGAKKADDFEAYATENEYTAQSATFDKEESSAIPNELAVAADELKEGEVTDVIETSDGYYVAKVTSLFDKDATEAKKETIIMQRKQEKYDEVVDGWKEKAEITLDEKAWAKVDFKTLGVTLHIDDTDAYADEVETDDVAEQEETTEEATEETEEEEPVDERTEETEEPVG